MHTEMWEHPSVRENLATLERRGVEIIPPESGRLAGGDSGEGRLADPAVIVGAGPRAARAAPTRPRPLRACGWWSSAGGTREPLDPVRFITNRSSGKQGHAIAVAAARRGASGDPGHRLAPALPPDVVAAVTRIDVETRSRHGGSPVGAAAEGPTS